ncbi:alpha-1-antitrypsin homolog [Anguilla anguilla]|uniref:alpha-1-antitrypsin homolog n=1 Tax=Anguilla anguilla TaxID=7936 RepID=UPI0015AFF8DA|nr:alpha-1-antitrypsin homolog [Anguilla anguilla]
MQGFLHCALTSLLLVVVWTHSQGGDHKAHQQHLHHEMDKPHPVHGKGEEACHKLAPPNADFAFALYKKMATKSESRNVFFSPLGISTALSLLGVGSKGDTHQQLYHALGYSQFTTAQVNEAYEHLQHMLGHSQGELKLDKGSAIVLQDGFKPLQKFLDDGKHYYQAQGFTVDFKKPEVAVQAINKFIAEKTDNKIPDLLSSVESDTLMVLLNYIHFRGKWEKPFDAKNTGKADFKVDENTTVSVDMMKRMGRYSYYYDRENHTSVLMLPYKGNASMMILLPCEGKMKDLEAILSKEYIRHWHDSLFKTVVDLEMPKFSVSGSYSLKEFLKEMGVVAAFSDTADLSGISEDVGLKVSKVSHKAVLSVDEKGTEAAAATVVEMIPMSLPDTVSLNRPFLLLILEESTKSILFMGKIINPTAQ